MQIICYALNKNHFHLLLKQLAERGIEKFMHRLGTGFSMYFNLKYRRSGSLFQGKFKAIHINSNEYLLRLSAYINLNDHIHQLGGKASKLSQTSWAEFITPRSGDTKYCDTEIILGQFKNSKEYQRFAEEALENIVNNK